LESGGQKQAAWRTDPAKAGAGGSIGDIGTHAFHLSEFISGLRCNSLLADLESFVGERRLDDNAHILTRYENGAKGMLWASQVATGKENGLKISVYGDKAGLSWAQENPNYLSFTAIGAPAQLLSRGGPSIGDTAAAMSRIPAGHPEGFLEGFATLYSDIADLILEKVSVENSLVPSVEDGLRGMQFINAAVKSNEANSSWVEL
jgi:predicted dehydrogenase